MRLCPLCVYASFQNEKECSSRLRRLCSFDTSPHVVLRGTADPTVTDALDVVLGWMCRDKVCLQEQFAALQQDTMKIAAMFEPGDRADQSTDS